MIKKQTKSPKVKITCPCGKEFEVTELKASYGRKYCSLGCVKRFRFDKK